MPLNHPLHLAVAEALLQHIPLFVGEHRGRDTRMCLVDLLVVVSGQVRVIVEIEESGFLPTKICGKFLQAALATHFIRDSQAVTALPYAENLAFIQVLDGSKYVDRSTSKVTQAQLIEKQIRTMLPLKGSRIADYRLFFVSGASRNSRDPRGLFSGSRPGRTLTSASGNATILMRFRQSQQREHWRLARLTQGGGRNSYGQGDTSCYLITTFLGAEERTLIEEEAMNKTTFLPMSRCVFSILLLSIVLAPFARAQEKGQSPQCSNRYEWHRVTENAEWQGRAGLQAVELRNTLYVMGGRGAFDPFGTVIYPDVWRSVDRGAAWTQMAAAAWPARAYFQAVTFRGEMFVFGGQNFDTLPNPDFPGCSNNPPGVPCLPFVPNSTFYDDVWKSRDGANWNLVTPVAGWAGRAGLSAVVFKGHIYVLGGSQGDDASTGGLGRILFNDVWKSSDGETWMQVTDNAPWPARAGAAVVVKNGYIFLLGGERGFTCGGAPGCNAERDLYFHDVWRSRNGEDWELVTPAAGWSARPGHQCVVLINQIVCFGGYGEPQNPNDMWVSDDGKVWEELKKPASPPWNAARPNDVKYDFDALLVRGGRGGLAPSIMTFGGDRERFELPPEENATRVDNDVWRMSPPGR